MDNGNPIMLFDQSRIGKYSTASTLADACSAYKPCRACMKAIHKSTNASKGLGFGFDYPSIQIQAASHSPDETSAVSYSDSHFFPLHLIRRLNSEPNLQRKKKWSKGTKTSFWKSLTPCRWWWCRNAGQRRNAVLRRTEEQDQGEECLRLLLRSTK